MVVVLSVQMSVGAGGGMPNPVTRARSHSASLQAWASTKYLTSMLERATVSWRFELQLIIPPARMNA